MKCEQGDLAKIIFSLNEKNIGKIVLVDKYIGKFNAGGRFDFRGLTCVVHVADHYLMLSGDGLSNMFGDTPKAYIADSWLEPLRPDTQKTSQKEKIPYQEVA